MSIEFLERAAAALGDELKEAVVFVGAATLPLWITDPAAPPLRPTTDVDVVVEASTLIAYNKFEGQLRGVGFQDEGTIFGRFLYGDDLQLDSHASSAWQSIGPGSPPVRGFESLPLRLMPRP